MYNKIVYVAGKYRDTRGEYYVRQNIRTAERFALQLWKDGLAVICPHKNTAGFGGAHGISDEVWLAGDLVMIGRCDAVFVLPNWETSSGTKKEIAFAKENKIPCFFTYASLMNALKNGEW